MSSTANPLEALLSSGAGRRTSAAAAVAALGIVYGDLGTSPLYSYEAVTGIMGGPISPTDALGILSLVFWSLALTISIKYCLFVMRADNHGEGGILALMSLIGANRPGGSRVLVAMALFGAALIYGDGIITPAISVLSALEGVNVATDALKPYVMPASIAILLTLFAAQSVGTARIGKIFGPVMLLWFVIIAVLGAAGVAHHPEVVVAVDPRHAAGFLLRHGWGSLAVLGGVFLTITGGEALYADMGHIGRNPIRFSWYGIVLPALLLNYAGQTALLIDQPSITGNPFFRLSPGWAIFPMVVLATAATIIASQAIITGSFSLTRQAMQLGWFPGVAIRQTSAEEYGQIYVPFVNWTMMVLTIAITIGFGSSDRLAGAYGTAVSTTMLMTTALLFNAMRQRWGWSLPTALLTSGIFLVVDLGFFSANLLKIADGGWLPLLFGTTIFLVMTTWHRGVEALRQVLGDATETSEDFLARLSRQKVPRVPGTAVFLTRAGSRVPLLMRLHVDQLGALQEKVVALTVLFEDVPRVASGSRLEVEPLAENFWHVTVHYGFVEVPNLPASLAAAKAWGCAVDLDHAVYLGSHDDVVRSKVHRTLARWRLPLFAFLYRNSERMVDRFDLPADKFVALGRQVEL